MRRESLSISCLGVMAVRSVQEHMRIAAAVLALLAAASAGAVTIVPGDIADAPPPFCWGASACISAAPPPHTFLLSNAYALKATLTGPYIVAFGPNGHLFATPANFTAAIAEYDTSLAVVHTIPWPFLVVSMTVAQNGDIYVLSSSGTVAILSPAGTVQQTFAMPFTPGPLIIPASLDLGADQCTIFYTDGAQTGRRFDVCAQHALPDLAPGPWNAVRAMSDGGYIAGRNSTLSIFDAQNHLLRTFTPQIDSVSALAFDADPRFVWVGTTGTIAKIDLANGARVAFGGVGPLYLAVNGEQRPTAAAFAPTIPALSPPLLLALALGLTVLAWQRLRG